VLILTVSRGAYVALVIGYLWAAFLCRRFIPPSRIAAWVLAGGVAGLIALGMVSLVDPHVAGAIWVRLFENPASMGVSEASSGRTDIWAQAIGAMMSNPVTLFTGFGWNVYATMPFVFVTHNTYLDQWFNLGLLGVAVFVMLLWQSVATANRAAGPATDPTMRRYLIAFIFGILALAVAVFFANLYTSTPYIWMYVGLTMRGAIFVLDKAEQGARVPPPVRVAPLGTSWRRA
jgi:O-antigen ligase